MATQDKNRTLFDRRVELLRPVNTVNSYNEDQLVYEVAYSNYPAKKEDSSQGDESQEGNIVRAESETGWEIRFIPGLAINATWKLKDMYDGKIYEIIAPPSENGRRISIKIKTKVVQ